MTLQTVLLIAHLNQKYPKAAQPIIQCKCGAVITAQESRCADCQEFFAKVRDWQEAN